MGFDIARQVKQSQRGIKPPVLFDDGRILADQFVESRRIDEQNFHGPTTVVHAKALPAKYRRPPGLVHFVLNSAQINAVPHRAS